MKHLILLLVLLISLHLKAQEKTGIKFQGLSFNFPGAYIGSQNGGQYQNVEIGIFKNQDILKLSLNAENEVDLFWSSSSNLEYFVSADILYGRAV